MFKRSWLGTFWARYSRNPMAVAGAAFLIILLLAVLLANVVAADPYQQNLLNRFQPPSLAHPLGTDQFGRDQLSRVIYGGRASLTVGLGSMIVSVLIGLAVGLQSGLVRGWWDGVLMRITDGVAAFPTIFLIVAVTAVAGASLGNVLIIIGVTTWPVIARLIRSEILSLREREYILAAIIGGAGSWRIMRKHLIPNVLPTLIVAATLQVAFAILTEATLSFLGLGVTPPTPSWGNMLTIAQDNMFVAPWVVLAPGGAIIVTVLCLNFVGDGLRESLDPRLRRL
jgi:peptide/nickel transport system permease protein